MSEQKEVPISEGHASRPARAGRPGGRKARHDMRSAPLADDVRPIKAGMEGGTFSPLSDGDLDKINEAVLNVLENIGLSQATPSCVEACEKLGAKMDEDGRLRFPRKTVLDTIKNANRDFILHGQDPIHDMHPQGKKVYFGTAGAAVHVVDVEKNEYRESFVRDIYDAARIVEGLDNIHFFQRPMVARDIVDPLEMDLNTLYASLSGTTKHVGTSFTLAEYVPDALEMMYKIAGGEAAFRARPFVSNSNCFVVPPLRFAADACDVLEECIKGGMPVLLLSAGAGGGQLLRRLLPAPWCKRLLKFWPGWFMLMGLSQGTRQYSAPGHLFQIYAQVPCQAVQQNRAC